MILSLLVHVFDSGESAKVFLKFFGVEGEELINDSLWAMVLLRVSGVLVIGTEKVVALEWTGNTGTALG